MTESIATKNRFPIKQSLLFRAPIFRPVIAFSIARALGKNLTPNGRDVMKGILTKVLEGERVWVSREIPPMLEGAKYPNTIDGKENIPTKGATLMIGIPHINAGNVAGMGQFFEASIVLTEGRTDVLVPEEQASRLVMQRGLARPRPIIGSTIRRLSAQLYQMAGDSFAWEVVEPPEFNPNNKSEIINKQGLSSGATKRLEDGGAMIIYPDGTDVEDGSLVLPRKFAIWLARLQSKDITILPMRVRRGEMGEANMIIGKQVHISELPFTNRRMVDTEKFIRQHIAVLG